MMATGPNKLSRIHFCNFQTKIISKKQNKLKLTESMGKFQLGFTYFDLLINCNKRFIYFHVQLFYLHVRKSVRWRMT